MTIKVEREALITVLGRSPSWQPYPCEETSLSSDDDSCVVLNIPTKSQCLDDESARSSADSDEDSLCASSTSSDSLSCESSVERRVSFASDLVSEEWTRPYTPREEISNLYYSTEDTNR